YNIYYVKTTDSIRIDLVTGVQTCALPILGPPSREENRGRVRHPGARVDPNRDRLNTARRIRGAQAHAQGGCVPSVGIREPVRFRSEERRDGGGSESSGRVVVLERGEGHDE